jgi:hypothetical protein
VVQKTSLIRCPVASPCQYSVVENTCGRAHNRTTRNCCLTAFQRATLMCSTTACWYTKYRPPSTHNVLSSCVVAQNKFTFRAQLIHQCVFQRSIPSPPAFQFKPTYLTAPRCNDLTCHGDTDVEMHHAVHSWIFVSPWFLACTGHPSVIGAGCGGASRDLAKASKLQTMRVPSGNAETWRLASQDG